MPSRRLETWVKVTRVEKTSDCFSNCKTYLQIHYLQTGLFFWVFNSRFSEFTDMLRTDSPKTHQKSAVILVCLVGQNSLKFWVDILGETMTS